MPTSINQDVSQALDGGRYRLAQEIVARHYQLEPESWQPYGSVGRDKCVQDAEYHLMYLSEAIAATSPSVFLDYVAWLKVLFAGLGFPGQAVEVTLDCTGRAIRDSLPPDMAAVADEYLEMAMAEASHAPTSVPSFIESHGPLGELARQYRDALLRGERHLATRLVVQAAEGGANIKDIYLHVFQPFQREIGRLWQMNQISVAQEHYCTAATQLAMAQLYPYTFSAERSGRRLVATCVSGELHEIGARIVADLFEMAGWDTYYLGANTPTRSIVRVLEERRPDLLAISATMTFHVRGVADLIAHVRATDLGRRIPVIVGGYPFNVTPELWRRVGADGSARDAVEAVSVAQRLVSEAPLP
jgi:methanogenic corrinoid protein MtbC1